MRTALKHWAPAHSSRWGVGVHSGEEVQVAVDAHIAGDMACLACVQHKQLPVHDAPLPILPKPQTMSNVARQQACQLWC